jgi:hypothetical protein
MRPGMGPGLLHGCAGWRVERHRHGGAAATGILDDDGNAVFLFFGASCAAGTSDVVADVLAGTHPTYTTTFTIVPPVPTI